MPPLTANGWAPTMCRYLVYAGLQHLSGSQDGKDNTPSSLSLAALLGFHSLFFAHNYLGRQGFPDGSVVKNLPIMQETQVQSLGQKNPLEKETATHSSILAWEIPWTEEPGELQTMESQRVQHDLATEHGTQVDNQGQDDHPHFSYRKLKS